MMKNLRKNALISLLIVLAIIVLLARTVNASQEFLQASGETLLVNPGSENQTTNTTTNTTTNSTSNITQNTTSTNILGTTNNVQKVNNINDATKDIPQTGENDIYMITVIGIAAIVIGGVAFTKSKKYDIQ